jgi:23S rRNA-/tRNA-specific pseudouridylate synthase
VVDRTLAHEVTVDEPIARSDEQTFAVSSVGKPAQTLIRPIASGANATLVEVDIRSGRTHQIRVHLASLGHAVCGDRKYGSAHATSRLMLHAWRLELPGSEEIISPVPPDFRAAAEALGLTVPTGAI